MHDLNEILTGILALVLAVFCMPRFRGRHRWNIGLGQAGTVVSAAFLSEGVARFFWQVPLYTGLIVFAIAAFAAGAFLFPLLGYTRDAV